jgi:UDP-N-acetylmuramate dehydrogenase
MIQREQERMSSHTTFRVGGPAAFYLVPETLDEVAQAVAFAGEKNLPYYVIGKGSNILVGDLGYDGVVIEIGKGLEDIRLIEDNKAEAQAGISLAKMASFLAENNLAGFEFASGIPGTLGGAVAMNAGAYGGEIKDVIVNAKVLTEAGDIVVLTKEELDLSYRSSAVQRRHDIVLSAVFSFEKGEKGQIQEKMKELNPSAGSTFKRPEGHFAGKLIEDAGLRGYRVGDAQVSEKHCGFVVNRGNATAAQIRKLMEDVAASVKEEFDVELEPEVRMLGRF